MYSKMFANVVTISLAFVFLCISPARSSECARIPRFEDYPVADIFRGNPVSPRLETKQTRLFRTRLIKGAKEGPNFAGHYTAVVVGCGTSCETLYLVDAISVKVFYLPEIDMVRRIQISRNLPELPYEDQYRLNSRLMIAFRRQFAEGSKAVDGTLPDVISFYEWKNDEFDLICEKHNISGSAIQDSSKDAAKEKAYTPPKGSDERKAIMDALRHFVKNKSGLEVIFVVQYLKVKNGWAWAVTNPQSKDGSQHYESISGLLHKKNTHWFFVEGPPEWADCEEDPECSDPAKYFKKLAEKYPAAPQEIFPK